MMRRERQAAPVLCGELSHGLRGPWRVAGLIAGCLSIAIHAQAATPTTTNAQRTPAVVMMIGGMANDDSTQADHASSQEPISTTDEDTNRLSIIIQPGSRTSSTIASEQNSAAIASRVMALAPLINEAARAVDVDRALLMAVIDVESGGNPQAISPKGATGLMQLMPRTGQRHGASDLFDPRQNVAAGARYLKALTNQFGDLSLALAAYNAGEGAVQKYGGQIPPYAETMSYVPKVIARYRWYRAMTADGGASLQDASARFLRVRSDSADN
jgi:soluble lytic murein transglycosylase-like protein